MRRSREAADATTSSTEEGTTADCRCEVALNIDDPKGAIALTGNNIAKEGTWMNHSWKLDHAPDPDGDRASEEVTADNHVPAANHTQSQTPSLFKERQGGRQSSKQSNNLGEDANAALKENRGLEGTQYCTMALTTLTK